MKLNTFDMEHINISLLTTFASWLLSLPENKDENQHNYDYGHKDKRHNNRHHRGTGSWLAWVTFLYICINTKKNDNVIDEINYKTIVDTNQ